MAFNVKVEALAYRMWCYATAIDWNCTIPELATALNANMNSVRAIAVNKNWANRFRSVHSFKSDVKSVGFNVLTSEVYRQTTETLDSLRAEASDD